MTIQELRFCDQYLVGVVYEHFLKESYDLCWKNKDQEEVREELP